MVVLVSQAAGGGRVRDRNGIRHRTVWSGGSRGRCKARGTPDAVGSQPSVLGELLCGIVLANLSFVGGSAEIEFVRSNAILRFLAEVGVLILLFDVGLETDFRAFARVGVSAVLVAGIGVVFPFFLGWAVAVWFLSESPALVHIFAGDTLTATSVGITVRVLKDLGVTGRPEGQKIIGAAISASAVTAIILKATAFLGITVVLGHYLSGPIVRLVARTGEHGMLLIVGIGLCFTLAYVAELVGLAGIIGAFAAGRSLTRSLRNGSPHQSGGSDAPRAFVASFERLRAPLLRIDGTTGQPGKPRRPLRAGYGRRPDPLRRHRQAGVRFWCNRRGSPSLRRGHRDNSPE